MRIFEIKVHPFSPQILLIIQFSDSFFFPFQKFENLETKSQDLWISSNNIQIK